MRQDTAVDGFRLTYGAGHFSPLEAPAAFAAAITAAVAEAGETEDRRKPPACRPPD